MNKELEFLISGLKCDNPSCNHRDDSIEFAQYPGLINSRCPKCNEVWLTQADYDRCVKMYKNASIVIKIWNIIKWFNPTYYFWLLFGDKTKRYSFVKRDFIKK